MSGKIFNLDDQKKLHSMDETDFATEDEFQRLLEDHPDLLAGDQINANSPRRWLLIKREIGIADDPKSGDRWSLDHLFVDQDGIPTLVEVKRSTDTRLRREVVGQLFDYAANAVVHWSLDQIRSLFTQQCNANSTDAETVLDDFLADVDTNADVFWESVKTNLHAGKIRLLFVANSIPSELRRIVEFLNAQMDPAEVLAVEIRQFNGNDSTTLVPTVFGHPKSRSSSASAMKFSVTINGEKHRHLAKHRAVHLVVRTLAEAGHEPEKLNDAIGWKEILIKVPSELNGESVVERLRAHTKTKNPDKEWMVGPEELIEFHGQTYAVGRKFFKRTPEILKILCDQFQTHDITFERE